MNVYFDNAATTKMSQVALDAMIPCLENVYAKRIKSSYSGAEIQGGTGESKRGDRNLYRAQPNEIYFTSGGSEADNQAIVSAAKWGTRRNKNILFPHRSSIMPYFIHCRSWKKRVTK